jgi:hypothetical protein
MNNPPRIIIPGGAERVQQRDNVRVVSEDNQPKFNLPQEMKDEVRKFVPEAKEVAMKMHELLVKGPAAQVALICQEPTRLFIGAHLQSILPQMVRTFAQNDRMQIAGFFRQLAEQRMSPANLSAERLDKRTYELAMNDFMSIISRVPAQIFPFEVGLPDVDLESPGGETPSSETPPQDTTQGET